MAIGVIFIRYFGVTIQDMQCSDLTRRHSDDNIYSADLYYQDFLPHPQGHRRYYFDDLAGAMAKAAASSHQPCHYEDKTDYHQKAY